ncbi:MAG: alpha-E domain-containing protein [Clostridiales bacterium]|nr:alpha-E domain-containing protein [Clostridiales bacterium]
MGIISVENTDRLFWLGRYSERVYTTIKLFAESFDTMIDMDELGSLDGFCRRLEIPNIYTSGADFVGRYCFDPEDPNSIYSNLTRAYDNCIVLREEIGSDTISYIQLAMYEMNRARISESPLIELQHVLDDILAFWGIVDDEIDSENVRNIIKVGKRVERLDLYARLHMSREELKREVDRLSGRIWRTCLKYRQSYLDELNRLIDAPRIDYTAIVQKTEMLLEE